MNTDELDNNIERLSNVCFEHQEYGVLTPAEFKDKVIELANIIVGKSITTIVNVSNVSQPVTVGGGCATHPKYGVKRRPRSGCESCWKLWKTKHPNFVMDPDDYNALHDALETTLGE